MAQAQTSTIVQLSSNGDISTLSEIPSAIKTGLLVCGDDHAVDCHQALATLRGDCAGIAFVLNRRLPYSRRIVSDMSLSQHYGAVCRVFSNEKSARAWLDTRLG
ncbi:MAG: hypothetical protein AAFN11_09470 [Chloroflexota bacterium]